MTPAYGDPGPPLAPRLPSDPTRARRVAVVASISALLLVVALVVVLVVGGSGGTGGTTALAERVVSAEGDVRRLLVVDVAAARSALDLPADADPTELDRGSEAGRRLGAIVPAFGHLLGLPSPMQDAIDLGRVTAVASDLGDGGRLLTVAETDQGLDEIAEALDGTGYQRDGDLLVAEDPPEALLLGLTYTAIGVRDGVLALSGDQERGAEAVAAALDEPRVDDELALGLLDRLDGPYRGVVVPADPDCVTSYAVVDPFVGDATLVLEAAEPGSVEVTLDDDADDDADGGAGDLVRPAGEPKVGDGEVSMPVAATERLIGDPGSVLLGPEILPGDLWSCG